MKAAPPTVSDLIDDTTDRKRPVRVLALSLICFVSIALIGLQVWSTHVSRQTQMRNANVATNNMARALADHADSAFDLVDLTLAGVADAVRQDGVTGYGERLHAQLGASVARAPILEMISIYDASGTRTLASALDPVHRDNAAMRPFFQHHHKIADKRLFIGAPYLNRIGGAWLLPISRRLDNPDGSFAGVAVADLRLAIFRKYYESFDIGTAGTIVLALDDGKLAVQHPFNQIATGSDIGTDSLFALWRASGDAGSASGKGNADDVARVYSYRHLQRHPLLVSVALSEAEVLSTWWAATYISTVGVALVLLVMLWMAVRLFRHVGIRDRLEAELRNAQQGLVTKNRSLKLLARNDSLTGIANRRHFDARLDSEFKRAAREGTSLAVVLRDVDHFKKYNDHYGHPGGDACLQFIAQCVRAGRRSSRNLAARVGGEEFAILLPDTDLYGAIAIADSVRKSIASAKREHAGNPSGYITLSCGVHAILPGQGKVSPKTLIEAADAALYQAKAKGRNCVSPDAVEVALRAHRLPVASS
jgi:diguanylate cyclase (GGDEF)-like protein